MFTNLLWHLTKGPVRDVELTCCSDNEPLMKPAKVANARMKINTLRQTMFTSLTTNQPTFKLIYFTIFDHKNKQSYKECH
jgi:hypothetical protein